MKNVSFGVGKMLKSEELNARFGDLAGGSILSGFRLAPGSSNYLISLVRDAAPTMKVLLPDGTRLEETGDALDVVAVRPNLASANRIDVLYVTYKHERGKDFSYELVEGVAGLPLDIIESDRKLALGYITVRPRQAVIATDLTSLPIGLKKIGRFGETIKQVLFTTTENQTVINLEHDFLVGQNRVSLTIGGVKQFFGKDYDETSTRQLTMKEPLPGGLACEVLVSTSTRVFAEDFKKETDAAKQATVDAVAATKAALDAKTTAYTEMKTPVANLASIGSTYPTAVDGTEVQTLDDGKIYRKEKGVWVYRKELTPGPVVTFINQVHLQKYYVSVKEFGAVGNGTTDDAPAFRSAITEAERTGKGIFVPKGTYLMNSLSGFIYEDCEYVLASEIGFSMVGEAGAIFKMADEMIDRTTAARGSCFMFQRYAKKQVIQRFTIEMNGTKNLKKQGSLDRIYLGILLVDCEDCDVYRIKTIDCSGHNAIMIKSHSNFDPRTGQLLSKSGLSINNTLKKCTSINGGTSIAGNVYQNDYSAFYFDSSGEVSSNKVVHDAFPRTNSGGIEIHASDVICRDNDIEKSYPGIYICSDVLGDTTRNVTCKNNHIKKSVVHFWFTGYGDFDGIDVIENQMTSRLMGGHPEQIGILTSLADDGVFNYTQILKNVSICNNLYVDNQTSPSTDLAKFIRVGIADGLKIEGNTVRNCSSTPFVLRSSPYGLKNVSVKNNKLIDWGRSPSAFGKVAIALDFSGSSSKPSVTAFVAENILIKNNEFIQTGGVSNTEVYGIYANWSDDSKIKNVDVVDTTTSINGTNFFMDLGPKASYIPSLLSGGITSKRPVVKKMWQQYFDTNLNRPIWWNGTNWINSNGSTV